MPRNLKVSHPLIAYKIPFVNITYIYIMTFRVARWDTLGDSLVF